MADLDRVLKALNHPVRRQILAALAEEPHSAKSLSRKLRMELSLTAYHLNQVLNRDCGIMDLVDVVQRRGALEKFFRIDANALRESARDSAKEDDGKEATLEECVLALVIGVVAPPDNCPPPLPS